jgi:serine/threonine-protein kinase
MSPEQATGDMSVGAATDVYALGCVLYEMLVGEPPYTGSTAQAVLGKIIAGELASAREHRASVPAHVDAVIRRALEKLPADRFAAAQDLARALTDPGFRHGEHGTGLVEASARWRRLALMGWGAAGVAVSALGYALLQPGPAAPVQRFALPFELAVDPVLLPDGSGVVAGQPTEEGRAQLVLRTWADLTPRPIAGTEGMLTGSAMAPGGSEVAFVTDAGLKVASLQGGGVRVLADSAACCVRWGEDGYVYYSRARSRNIARVRASGGPIEQVTEPEQNRLHGDYQVLPDRDLAVFAVFEGTGFDARIDAVRLSTGERKTVTAGARPFATPTGHLVFASLSGDVMAAPFDGDALELEAPPVTLVNGVSMGNWGSAYSVSESGTLAYVVGEIGDLHELVWVNRNGEATPVDPSWRFEPGSSAGWSLSPDGNRIAVREQGQGSAIWIKDVLSGARSRLTLEEGLHRRPRWTADGQAVTYLAGTDADLNVWSRRADGTGDAELLLDFAVGIAEGFWSPDGVWLMLRPGSGADLGLRDILGIRLGADTTMTTFVATREFAEESPALSPDMRWLAYSSDETGRPEVYVRPFPDVDAYRVLVSRAGGVKPVWSHDGRELFFVSGETRELMAGEVRSTPRFEVASVETLFTLPGTYVLARTADFYDATPAGDRFLMARRVDIGGTAAPQLILVQNWFEELNERVPN